MTPHYDTWNNCVICASADAKKRYEEQSEEMREETRMRCRKRYANSRIDGQPGQRAAWLKYAWKNADYRSRIHNRLIEKHQLNCPDVCPVLGIPLDYSCKGFASPNSPSLDRIDNSKGYEIGNVRVISWRANSLRADGTEVEFAAILRDMKKIRKTPSIPTR